MLAISFITNPNLYLTIFLSSIINTFLSLQFSFYSFSNYNYICFYIHLFLCICILFSYISTLVNHLYTISFWLIWQSTFSYFWLFGNSLLVNHFCIIDSLFFGNLLSINHFCTIKFWPSGNLLLVNHFYIIDS